MKLQTVGEDAMMLYLGEDTSARTSALVHAAAPLIERCLGADLVDLVPSYASLLIVFDPLRTNHPELRRQLRDALQSLRGSARDECRTVTLPVYYAPESGEDLERVADSAGLSVEKVIELHAYMDYSVYAIGFAPGFAYLGQVDERIATPRLATPRATVPRGAVAIADRQTAVYPATSPGGWNLIGRCPVPMFDPTSEPHMPVAVGELVRFEPISRQQFLNLGGELP